MGIKNINKPKLELQAIYYGARCLQLSGEKERAANIYEQLLEFHGQSSQNPFADPSRVAVARAIVSRPALVLADEPTANLDSHATEQLMELFVELNTRHSTTFVMATHDQRVMNYARRVIKMLDGRIAGDIEQDPV